MRKQNTNTILMVYPDNFGFNEEAFLTNKFQQRMQLHQDIVQQNAIEEFDDFVDKLTSLGIEVIVHKGKKGKGSPDAVFPNNWISTHQEGFLITHPMAVANRREERNPRIIKDLIKRFDYILDDSSNYENDEFFLEGTGSVIFDHINKIAYSAISPRSNDELFVKLTKKLGYKAIKFRASGKTLAAIYHTNVMMSIGDHFAVVGLDTINKADRPMVEKQLKNSGKEIIALTNEQVYNCFAGNMLQLINKNNETVLALSETAYNSLSENQLMKLKKYNAHFCIANIPTIEKIGGGSARCMIAEVFTP